MASSSALNEFHEKYSKRGLVVIGMYHPKPRRARSIQEVQQHADDLKFRFPVALDHDWSSLKQFWYPKGETRHFTSVSFLLDQRGAIRFIHPGGEYHASTDRQHQQCQQDYEEMKRWVEKLLHDG